MPRGRPRKPPLAIVRPAAVKPAPAEPRATLVQALRFSASQLRGSHHGDTAAVAATRIEELEETLRQFAKVAMSVVKL